MLGKKKSKSPSKTQMYWEVERVPSICHHVEIDIMTERQSSLCSCCCVVELERWSGEIYIICIHQRPSSFATCSRVEEILGHPHAEYQTCARRSVRCDHLLLSASCRVQLQVVLARRLEYSLRRYKIPLTTCIRALHLEETSSTRRHRQLSRVNLSVRCAWILDSWRSLLCRISFTDVSDFNIEVLL